MPFQNKTADNLARSVSSSCKDPKRKSPEGKPSPEKEAKIENHDKTIVMLPKSSLDSNLMMKSDVRNAVIFPINRAENM